VLAAGAGEGARLVTEKLAFQKRLVHGRAVDLDQRTVPPARQKVDAAREQFLAGTAFADHQDRAVDPGDARGVVEGVEKDLALADQVGR